MEGTVVGVFEGDISEALIGGHEAVADDLDLGLVRDRLEVGVEDGGFVGRG